MTRRRVALLCLILSSCAKPPEEVVAKKAPQLSPEQQLAQREDEQKQLKEIAYEQLGFDRTLEDRQHAGEQAVALRKQLDLAQAQLSLELEAVPEARAAADAVDENPFIAPAAPPPTPPVVDPPTQNQELIARRAVLRDTQARIAELDRTMAAEPAMKDAMARVTKKRAIIRAMRK